MFRLTFEADESDFQYLQKAAALLDSTRVTVERTGRSDLPYRLMWSFKDLDEYMIWTDEYFVNLRYARTGQAHSRADIYRFS